MKKGIYKNFQDECLRIKINFKKNSEVNPETIKNNVYGFLQKNNFNNIKFHVEFDVGVVVLVFNYDYWGNVWRTELNHNLDRAING